MIQADLPERAYAPEMPNHRAVWHAMRPTRVTEADMAFAIAEWLDGSPWPLTYGEWIAPHRRSVRLLDLGDALACDGVVIATRNPPAVIGPVAGTNRAHLSEARAVARVALRGDHLRLYGLRAWASDTPINGVLDRTQWERGRSDLWQDANSCFRPVADVYALPWRPSSSVNTSSSSARAFFPDSRRSAGVRFKRPLISASAKPAKTVRRKGSTSACSSTVKKPRQ